MNKKQPTIVMLCCGVLFMVTPWVATGCSSGSDAKTVAPSGSTYNSGHMAADDEGGARKPRGMGSIKTK